MLSLRGFPKYGLTPKRYAINCKKKGLRIMEKVSIYRNQVFNINYIPIRHKIFTKDAKIIERREILRILGSNMVLFNIYLSFKNKNDKKN